MPDKRRFGLVNVICVHSNIVLAGRREIGERAVREGAVWGGSGMGQLTLQGWEFEAMYKELPL